MRLYKKRLFYSGDCQRGDEDGSEPGFCRLFRRSNPW